MIAAESLNQMFSSSVHITGSGRKAGKIREEDQKEKHEGNRGIFSGSNPTLHSNSKYNKSVFKSSRPDLAAEISQYSHFKHRLLVFACGPKSLVEECSVLSMQMNCDFRHEVFEL